MDEKVHLCWIDHIPPDVAMDDDSAPPPLVPTVSNLESGDNSLPGSISESGVAHHNNDEALAPPPPPGPGAAPNGAVRHTCS